MTENQPRGFLPQIKYIVAAIYILAPIINILYAYSHYSLEVLMRKPVMIFTLPGLFILLFSLILGVAILRSKQWAWRLYLALSFVILVSSIYRMIYHSWYYTHTIALVINIALILVVYHYRKSIF